MKALVTITIIAAVNKDCCRTPTKQSFAKIYVAFCTRV